FFFQAEDGIRDDLVTGVQTCALPISIARADKFFSDHPGIHKLLVVDDQDRLHGLFTLSDVERIEQERNAQFKPARDANFRLLCEIGRASCRERLSNAASGGALEDGEE